VSSPLLSLVVPTYNVARYLPEFFDGLDAQAKALDGVEVVFVDDGSTDESAALISDWIGRSGNAARLIRKDNGGLSSARNAGLAAATGEWVNFPDPDDILTAKYLANVRKFLRSKPGQKVDLAASNLVYLYEPGGRLEDTHPLKFKFTKHHRIVDLERHPAYIHLHANTAFYRRALLDEWDLRFDERIRPNFEDAHLTALYLAHFERPRIGMIEDAVYLYRRRGDGSSLVQASWTNELKYDAIPRFGWLDMLTRTKAEHGRIPRWMQNLVLYDLSFYFQIDHRTNSPMPGLSAACKEGFLNLVEEVLTYIDPEMIEGFHVNPISVEIKQALLIGLKRLGTAPAEGFVDLIDEHQQLVRVRYFFAGVRPEEEFRSRGFTVEPEHAKVRPIRYFDRALMFERTAWLPATSTIELNLDGRPLPLRIGMPELSRYTIGPRAMWLRLADKPPPSRERAAGATKAIRDWSGEPAASAGADSAEIGAAGSSRGRDLPGRLIARLPRVPGAKRTQLDDLLTRGISSSPYGKTRYHDAWLLLDRDTGAQDNAEHLYRYLRAEQPQVNAWFVLSPDSPDWPRLEAEGVRLIAHGSREHAAALLHCEHVISSQIDHYVTHPLDEARFGPRTWQYTFLQHGVTKDDLSNWINYKPISLMITATPDEHQSIVGDGTPYRYTSKEVKLTGFPRHDRLWTLAANDPAPDEPLLLVMPTWRRELLFEAADRKGNRRELRDDFWNSAYAKSWKAILESERIHKAAEENGWRVAFVPHPNMQGYVDRWTAPPHVALHRFDSVDIQKILARGGAMVTDYSSLAFEMAYIERPVVYFQFDQREFFNGTHAYRKGTWSYEDQGFGPVTIHLDNAVDAITDVIARGGVAEPEYAARMRDTFPFRDGKCSQRTYEAVLALSRPHQAVRRVR
jgi:glycosyltransferase involved in cell wall biosynthesis/CDP-glycerol glycerophosphotransferase (TagB/SpsB family)